MFSIAFSAFVITSSLDNIRKAIEGLYKIVDEKEEK